MLIYYFFYLFWLPIHFVLQLIILCLNLSYSFILFFWLKNLLTYQLQLVILTTFDSIWSRPVCDHNIKLLIIKAIIIFIMLKYILHNFFHQQVNIIILNFHFLKIIDLFLSCGSKLLLGDYLIFINVMYLKL